MRDTTMRQILERLVRSFWRHRVTIRAIRPDDRERLVQAFRALDQQSIYQRFLFPKRELSDTELRQITECDGVRVVALVATVGSGDQQVIVGLGQYARSGATADIAFTVREDFRGWGIAQRLLRRLVRLARAQGISRFRPTCSPTTGRCCGCSGAAACPMQESQSHGVVHLTLTLAEADPQAGALRAGRNRDRIATFHSPAAGEPRLPWPLNAFAGRHAMTLKSNPPIPPGAPTC